MAYEKIDLETPQPNGKVGEPGPTAWAKVRRMFIELYGGRTDQPNRLHYMDANAKDAFTEITQAARNLLDDADTSAMLTTLGISDFVKSLLDDTSASAFLDTLGSGAVGKSLLASANQSAARANLGLGSAAVVAALGSAANGDITEYISNANGQCWRFINGLQVCKHIFNVVGPTQAFGALFISPSAATWTFPALFVGEQPIIIPQNSAESVWALGGTGPNQNANALFRCIYPASLSSTQTVTGMAIGRWK